MNTVLSLLWPLYLGMAPIAWLPGIGPNTLYDLKFFLIAAAVSVTWFQSIRKRRFSLPGGLAGFGGLLLLVFSASFGVIQTPPDLIVHNILDLIMPFIMLWSMFLLGKDPRFALAALMRGSLFVSVFSFFVVAFALVGAPAWVSPAEFGHQTLAVAGFEARRTGWSNGVALYTVFAFLPLFLQGRGTSIKSAFSVSIVSCIVGSQFVVGGRGGLLASIVMILLASLFVLPRRWFIGIAIASTISLAFIGHSVLEEAMVHLRADRLETNADSFSKLNNFSAGRLQGFIVGVEMIQERPFVGYGFDDESRYRGAEIHNLWLRLALQGGVLLPVSFALIVGSLLFSGKGNRAVRLVKRRGHQPGVEHANFFKIERLLLIVVIGGLVMTLYEPRMLLGSFQKTAGWWASVGILLALRERNRHQNDDISERRCARPGPSRQTTGPGLTAKP